MWELSISCRIGKHVGEFESMFLSDLEGGQLSVKDLHCGLEGKVMHSVISSWLLNMSGLIWEIKLGMDYNFLSYSICRRTNDELGWWYISNLSEHFATGFLILAVIFHHILLCNILSLSNLCQYKWLLKIFILLYAGPLRIYKFFLLILFYYLQ